MSEPVNDAIAKSTWLFVAVGFAALGLLVGSVAGLSSAALTLPLFGFLFAFAGGSIIAFMGNVPRPLVSLAGIALASFCLAAVIALYVGLYVKVNEVLFKSPMQTVSGGRNSPTITLPQTTPASGGQGSSTITLPQTAAASGGQGSSTITLPKTAAAQQGYRDVLRSDNQKKEDYLRQEIARGRMSVCDACKELGQDCQK